MKLQMISGCLADSLTADGKEEVDMTCDERHGVTISIMNWLLDHPEENERIVNQLMQLFIEEFGECTTSGKPCECCGDCIYQWDLEIN